MIAISDTGAGVAHEHSPRLFDRFYRADAARDRQHGGAGIGCRSPRHSSTPTAATSRRTATATERYTFTVSLPCSRKPLDGLPTRRARAVWYCA